MARTTLDLEDDLLRDLKARAAREGTTLARLVNTLLRLAGMRERRGKYRFRLRTFKGGRGPRPGVALDSRDALYDPEAPRRGLLAAT
jgi:hypothetical protein